MYYFSKLMFLVSVEWLDCEKFEHNSFLNLSSIRSLFITFDYLHYLWWTKITSSAIQTFWFWLFDNPLLFSSNVLTLWWAIYLINSSIPAFNITAGWLVMIPIFFFFLFEYYCVNEFCCTADINECRLANRCLKNEMCINTNGSYYCLPRSKNSLRWM